MLHQNTVQFQWESKEFEDYPKTTRWYILAGIVILILLVITILSRNYLLSFIIIVGAFTLLLSKHEEVKNIEISEYGMKIGEDIFPYEKITSFWIHKDEKGNPLLVLKIDRSFHPMETIPIPSSEIPIEDLREFLHEFVEEAEMQEPLPHKIIKKLKI